MKINQKLIETLQARNISIDFQKYSEKLNQNKPKFQIEVGPKIKIRPVSKNQVLTQYTNFQTQSTESSSKQEGSDQKIKDFKDLDDFEKFEIINEINEFFLKDEISEKNLSEIAKVPMDNLITLYQLKFQVDLSLNSLQNLGYICPALIQLKLNGSIIKSLRDIGTSLKELQVLNVSRCRLSDLSGINGMPNLNELYAAFNSISDLEGVSYHQNLQILDLEGNEIEDFQQIDFDERDMEIKDMDDQCQFYDYKKESEPAEEIFPEVDGENNFFQNLNEEDLINQSIKYTNQNKQEQNNKQSQNILNRTFINTVKQSSKTQNQQQKRQNRYQFYLRYLDQFFLEPNEEHEVNSKLVNNHTIQGNPTKALKKKQLPQNPKNILQHILQNKNLSSSAKSLSDFEDDQDEVQDKLNKTMVIETKSKTELSAIRINSTKKINLLRKPSEDKLTITKKFEPLRPIEFQKHLGLNDKMKTPFSNKFSFQMKKINIKQEARDQLEEEMNTSQQMRVGIRREKEEDNSQEKSSFKAKINAFKFNPKGTETNPLKIPPMTLDKQFKMPKIQLKKPLINEN